MSEWGEWGSYAPPKRKIEQPKPKYAEVPDGVYTVNITLMEVKKSKKGYPMLAVRFKISDGEYKNRYIFMNQVIIRNHPNDSFTINICNNFLKSLNIYDDEDIKFNGVQDYVELVADVAKHATNMSFDLEYTTNDNGYRTFTII